jgi:hypothetical protein
VPHAYCPICRTRHSVDPRGRTWHRHQTATLTAPLTLVQEWRCVVARVHAHATHVPAPPRTHVPPRSTNYARRND